MQIIYKKVVDAVAKSIQEFGFKIPIVIDVNDGIIAGDTRLKASKKINLDKVPCIIADDLTPEQVKVFRLADNKVAEIAEWDFELLQSELEELELMDLDFSMKDFGFNAHTQNNLGLTDDDFLSDEAHEKKAKIITCPHCGEEFEET